MSEKRSKTDRPSTDDSQTPIEGLVVTDPQAFTLNVAKALEEMGKAASAWARPRERGEIVETGPASFAEMVETFSKVSQYWMADPGRVMEAQTSLFAGYMTIWNNSILRMAGEPLADAVEPKAADRRFTGEEWTRHLFYDVLKQVYIMTSRWADDLVERADGLDEHTRHKAAFYMKQVSNAISPSNFLGTNPELYRDTIASNGENLVRGMKMFAEDMAAGGGNLKIRQSDNSSFEVGRDLAVTPGKVIAQNDLCQIIQYEPATATVFKRPLMIVPPWINKYYILDLRPGKSMIEWLVANGHTVFVVSWVNPDERQADKDWSDYIREGIGFCLDTIGEATGESEVNAVGYCVGGTLLAASLALFAERGDGRIASTTFLTTQIDFTHAGDLKVFVDEAQLKTLEASMSKGYLEGSQMATAFNLLRSGELIWPYFVNNYLKGKAPLPFDLLYWNADATRMARANHLFYLRGCYLENRLSRGEMVIDGVRLDLGKVDLPVFTMATRQDHIAPARSVFVGSRTLGSKVEYVLAGSGHIAGVVNPPDRNKYQHWTGPAPRDVDDYDAWLKQARETPGSWWPHWQEWLERQNGEARVEARTCGGSTLTPIEDAPGAYVKA